MGGSYSRTSHGLGDREARDLARSARASDGALGELVTVHLGIGAADRVGQRVRGFGHLSDT